jgi:hypothetical protein
MIVSSYDEEKFQSMLEDVRDNELSATIKTDQDDPGQLKSFVNGVTALSEDSGIVVFVECARHKAQEVKSVMEQSGAVEVRIDDN